MQSSEKYNFLLHAMTSKQKTDQPICENLKRLIKKKEIFDWETV